MMQRNQTGSQEENRPRWFSPFLLCVLDFVLLNVSFYALNYWKQGAFDLSSKYFRLLIAFYVIWFFVSIFTKKFKVGSYGSYWDCIALYVRSGLYGAYCAVFVVVMLSLSELSRLHVFGTWALLVIQEGVIFTLYYAIAGKGWTREEGEERSKKEPFSRFLYEDFLEPLGISQSALARHIGVNPRVINEICREKRGISPRMAQLLEAALGMSAEFWMNAQAAYDLTTHRLSQFEKPEKMPKLATG